ncbi:MAG TPA: carboxypeptidase regulatory-like domain-containing protein [Pyrinomonadaceae bacterium]|jgi:plastocyanin|nr:carboxypeptidase regulatory-like domain-containing protein [Pyrinomonadaceae bacterium]
MLSKRAGLWLGLIATLGLLSLGSSCGGNKTETNDNAGTETGAAYTSKGDEGTISGTIAYTGTAPENPKIDTSADAQCTSKNPNLTAETWAVKDGKVANTFVYIKDGTLADGKKIGDLTGWPNMPTGATLNQDGCHYRPHVMGVVTKEEINIKNSDPTTHNIHFTPSKNPDWNQSQPNGAADLKHTLNTAEVMVPVKCNQHPWMKAYIGVMKHPFFAVTDEAGKFTISGVPPGKYTVVAWHEGAAGPGTEKTMEVTVPAKGSATADFSFGASAGLQGQPSSLPMAAAIEFPMVGRH